MVRVSTYASLPSEGMPPSADVFGTQRFTHTEPVDRYSAAFNYNVSRRDPANWEITAKCLQSNPNFEIKRIESCRREGKRRTIHRLP